MAAGLLFVLPVNTKRGEFTLSWKQAANIDWGTILLFGGGLAFGHLMVKTGLAEAVGRGMVALIGENALWSLTAVPIGTTLILTELASNTAALPMELRQPANDSAHLREGSHAPIGLLCP
ncbi:MAG: hypothetical protein IH977_04260 [Nitrospinae bacterium]|nr:hypothetical protein [Nitrospinota bacterium]